MEYGSKNNIFGLKMMVKSGVEIVILKFIYAQTLSDPFIITNLVIKRIFNEMSWGASMYHKWNFKPQISPIFHFEYVNEVCISGVLGVK